ncbi:hypothetical protein [Eggerthella guodeyinii]|uniref:Alanine racemase n=1 Tax=Eggerthella guodeyinii TaxID=2690837 RepID=A0A6N7RJK4_9ACTN|nr:hypothetical protein [Eggerthella guodeyinii]MRX81090.1 hypothetical protein [Eggerthella guodeyinii]
MTSPISAERRRCEAGKFLTSNERQWRLTRTILQGIIGVFVANVDLIVSFAVLDPALRALAVALVMAVLSPVMVELRAHLDDAGDKGSGAA